MSTTTIHIPRDLRDHLALVAAARRMGVGDLAEQILSEYLARDPQAQALAAAAAPQTEVA